MSRYDVRTAGPAWDALRDAADRVARAAADETTNLVELGKAYAALAVAMQAVTAASGQTSARYDAAAKALDLKTPKSKLAAFLEG